MMVKACHHQATVIGRTFILRVAAWLGDRLPRVDAASDRVDWFYVWLVAGPCLMAAISIGLYLVDQVCHTSILPSSVQPQRTLKGYAAAHSLADRQLEIIGLVAAAYPALLWIMIKMIARVGQPRSRAKGLQERRHWRRGGGG